MSACIDSGLEDAARRAVGNWKKFDSFGWHDRPAWADRATIVYTNNRDSGLLEESNAAAIAETLKPFMGRSVVAEHHGHWAVGWVDGYAIKVFDSKGKITKAYRAWYELQQRLEDYPVLDEEDHSRREYEATLKAIREQGYDDDLFAPPDDWEGEVFSWLSEHEQREVENRDDRGGWPSNEAIAQALTDLGYQITWEVAWVDVGEEVQAFDTEGEAIERCAELKTAGHWPAYRKVTPASKG